MRNAEHLDGPITEDIAVSIYAAGALCWRVKKKKLEVLLIHRQRYDDWSWPKGKLDKGETLAECAVREVYEEVGLPITLGRPLPSISYTVKPGRKEVHYWAAAVDDLPPTPDGKEVDAVIWCSPNKARGLLSNPSDLQPLEALVDAYESSTLNTWPLLILRHAKAKPRSAWTRAEGDRPLAATGKRQAMFLQRLLMAWHPGRIYTSDWLRCISTISPYAQATKAKVKVVPWLTEADHLRNPAKVTAVMEKTLTRSSATVVCTHRPVLPTVLAVLATHMSQELGASLPLLDPHLAPGEVLVAHISLDEPGTIVALEQHKPYED
ncbi:MULTISPECIES: NUDIX hydrolase [Arthrobacter]|uniref:NUDIX hydrolase n=1 Tax=Arthrobacter psychrochitiniphilus TaxID=291045 RepID=A0A2V3DTJ0_9MICC|nr:MULTISPECIES: NUDIX hydrolase [Arthrobacter]PXA66330.1 NUDIX hydrolase [Arthrobacter psychrochitiniphilus]